MSLTYQVYAEGGDAFQNFFDIEITGMPAPVFNEYQIADPMWEGKKEAFRTKGYTGIPENKAIFRAKTITLPTYAVKTADINFYSTQIRVPVAKMEFTPEFTVTFRVDQQWALYQALLRWRNTVFDPESGYTKFDSSNPIYMGLNRALRGIDLLKDMSFVGRCEAITITVQQPRIVQKGLDIKNYYYKDRGGPNRAVRTFIADTEESVYQNDSVIRRWRFQGAYPTKMEGLVFDYSSTSAQEITVTFSYLEMIEYYEKDGLNQF